LRNISRELRDRLEEIGEQRSLLQRQLDTLTTHENSLKILLQAEEARWGLQKPLIPELVTTSADQRFKGRTPLARFLLGSLAKGAKSIETLKTEAKQANILTDKKMPGRTLHFGLVGMANAGMVEKVEGLWRLKVRNIGSDEK